MKCEKVRFSLMLLLLVSSMFFPSAQQAFANHLPGVIPNGQLLTISTSDTVTDIIIGNGATLIIESGVVVSFTGVLTVQSGGKLIIEGSQDTLPPGKIEFVGTTALNGIHNEKGGKVKQVGAIVNLNPSAQMLINFGNWDISCGTFVLNGLAWTGTVPTIECNLEIVLNIPNDEILTGTTYTVDIPTGATAVLEDDLTIYGTLVNSFPLSNRALITLQNGIIDLTGGGSLDNICGNYATRGTTGPGEINNGVPTTFTCNDPTAILDNYSTPRDLPLSIDSVTGVLSNDEAGDNDDVPGGYVSVLSSSFLSSPSNGGVALNSDGSFVYTPNPGYVGPDSFTYLLEDGNGGTSNTSVNVDVTPVNDPPVAVDDEASTPRDTPKIIDVLDNDFDPNGGTLTIIVANDGTNGSSVINNGATVTYTPNPSYVGPDSFTYTIEDNGGLEASATVTVVVTSVNDPPVANDDEASTLENIPVIIDVLDNDFDPDGGTLTIISVNDGTSGTSTTDGATVTYTPNQYFNGQDSFTYTIDNDSGLTSSAIVNVDVTPVNDPPDVSIISPLYNAIFLVGEPVDFVGSALDNEDGNISSSLYWESSINGQIGTGASFTRSNLSEGVHVITTTTIDSGGLLGSDSITIKIQIDLENEFFCDDKTIAQLEKQAMEGKYNLIDNRGGPSTTLQGTVDADLILAGDFGDLVEANNGNDCIIGGSGNDDLRGGLGNDEIFGLGGDDIIRGNDGNDLLDGGNGGDDIEGNDGNDNINGGNNFDILNGGNGDDTMYGGPGRDEIIGGDGDDKIEGGLGPDTIFGGNGNDDLKGNEDDDYIEGQGGNDKIDGGIDEDILRGNDGNDKIKGGDGDDEIIGGAGDDKLEGKDGNDTITGGEGKDDIKGGNGNDDLRGGAGNDKIKGDKGDDVIAGDNGDDKLEGKDGNDTIKGGDGDDTLKGQAGDDTLDGGSDTDTCYEDKDDTLVNCEIIKPMDDDDHAKHDDD